MTLLTDDELKAVRDDDASWSDGYVAAEIANGGGLIAQRRSLLRHIDALQEQLKQQDKALRDSCPEHLRGAASPVGCVQNYIVFLECAIKNAGSDLYDLYAIDAAKEPTPLPGEGE